MFTFNRRVSPNTIFLDSFVPFWFPFASYTLNAIISLGGLNCPFGSSLYSVQYVANTLVYMFWLYIPLLGSEPSYPLKYISTGYPLSLYIGVYVVLYMFSDN